MYDQYRMHVVGFSQRFVLGNLRICVPSIFNAQCLKVCLTVSVLTAVITFVYTQLFFALVSATMRCESFNGADGSVANTFLSNTFLYPHSFFLPSTLSFSPFLVLCQCCHICMLLHPPSSRLSCISDIYDCLLFSFLYAFVFFAFSFAFTSIHFIAFGRMSFQFLQTLLF